MWGKEGTYKKNKFFFSSCVIGNIQNRMARNKGAPACKPSWDLLKTTLLVAILVAISLYLFFSRNPRGSSRQDPHNFRVSEFFVALLFPQFYILYYAVTFP